jgi:hypothetical protein
MALLQQQNAATAASPKREAPMQRLSRNAVAKPPRSIEFAATPTQDFFLVRSPLRGMENAVSKPSGSKDFGAAPTLENDQVVFFSESKQTMAIQQQQNVTAASTKRKAPMRRLSRNLSAVSARNLKKSCLGEQENAVSKPAGSIKFSAAPKPPVSIDVAAAPTLENDKVAFCTEIEQTTALHQQQHQQQNATAFCPKREALVRRLSRNLSTMYARNLKKSPLGRKKNCVSKPVGRKQFSVTPKPPASIQFSAAPTLENDEVACCSEIEQTKALQQQQNATAFYPKREALMRRLSRNLSAVCTRNLVKKKRCQSVRKLFVAATVVAVPSDWGADTAVGCVVAGFGTTDLGTVAQPF